MNLKELINKAQELQLNQAEEIKELEIITQTNKVAKKYLNTNGYLSLLKITCIASSIEQPNATMAQKLAAARTHAFKLIVLFGTEQKALTYLQRFENQKDQDTKRNLIHDACLVMLPKHEEVDYHLWQGIIDNNPPNAPTDKILRLLQLADGIQRYVKEYQVQLIEKIREKVLRENPQASTKTQNALVTSKASTLLCKTTSVALLGEYAANVCYEHRRENPQAAKVFFQCFIPEADFDTYLKLKPQDDEKLIPKISIDGSLFGNDNYVLYKLSPTDPRAAILGKMTSCCQSLGEEGHGVVVYGIENIHAGFYVLSDKKTDTVVAQSVVWNNAQGTIVFDSIESHIDFRRKEKALILAAFRTLAKVLVEQHGIYAVHVGLGGQTPEEFYVTRSNDSETSELNTFLALRALTPVNYSGYTDAHYQAILAHAVFPIPKTEGRTPKKYTEREWQELVIHLLFSGFAKTPQILEEELQGSGLNKDECLRGVQLAAKLCNAFINHEGISTPELFELFAAGIDPNIEMLGYTLMHYLARFGTAEELQQGIALVGVEQARRLAKRKTTPQQYTALAYAVDAPDSTTTDKMRLFLELFPENQRIDLLMDVDYDSVPVIRHIQVSGTAAMFELSMQLLPPSDRNNFYTGFSTMIDHDPLAYALQHIDMLRATIKYCPDDYLEGRLNCSIPGGSLLRLPVLNHLKWSQECFDYILRLTNKNKLLYVTLYAEPYSASFWSYVSSWCQPVKSVLTALSPDERYQALSSQSSITPMLKRSVLMGMKLSPKDLHEIFALIPKTYWLPLITNNSQKENMFTVNCENKALLAAVRDYYNRAKGSIELFANSIFGERQGDFEGDDVLTSLFNESSPF